MPPRLEYYFDYASPFSYLASHQLPGLLERTGAEVEHKPVLLGGIFKATGNQAPIMESCEPKRAYFGRTVGRWVEHYGAPFQFNPHFPINTVTLMRACVAAQRAGDFDAFHAVVFPAMWAYGRNLGDPAEIQKVLDEAGLEGKALLEATQDPAVKAALRANTDEAVARGAFGVPTFVVGDELFWGADHMLFVEKALA